MTCYPSVETNQDMVEDAVKYVIFLVDVDKLFDTALGMYDFSLVLLIAQQAQRVSSAIWRCRPMSHLFVGP